MKAWDIGLPVLGVLVFCNAAFSQGNLTPPGPPAPIMKSLDQIEARTPISSAPIVIGGSGSYYLTTNLSFSSSSGITILANNVTLDLNGFGITGGGTAINGIFINNLITNVVVRNGFISDIPGRGVVSQVFGTAGIVLEKLHVSGCLNDGIRITGSCVVRGCVVENVAGNGILVGGRNCLITDCVVGGCALSGILTTNSQTSGIRIINNTLMGNNTTNSANLADINIQAVNCLVERNFVNALTSGNGFGIMAGPFNGVVVINNVVIPNGSGDYSFTPSTDRGPVSKASAATNAFGNISL